MSDPDEYERYFRPTPEHHECECGAELTRENPPVPCDCGADCCSECVHICELCGHEGCDACQTDTGDGWLCNDHASEPQSTEARLMNNALDAVYEAMGQETPSVEDREAQEMLERIRKAG